MLEMIIEKVSRWSEQNCVYGTERITVTGLTQWVGKSVESYNTLMEKLCQQ